MEQYIEGTVSLRIGKESGAKDIVSAIAFADKVLQSQNLGAYTITDVARQVGDTAVWHEVNVTYRKRVNVQFKGGEINGIY